MLIRKYFQKARGLSFLSDWVNPRLTLGFWKSNCRIKGTFVTAGYVVGLELKTLKGKYLTSAKITDRFDSHIEKG